MPSRREQVIVELLERYNDLADPVRAGNGNGTTGVMFMPHESDCRILTWDVRRHGYPPLCTCARRSITELERLLRVMRESRGPLLVLPSGEKVSVRSCWWHVHHRYLQCELVQRRLVWRRGRWVGLNGHEQVVAQPGGWELALAAERDRRARQAGQRVDVKLAVWDPAVRMDRVARGVVWLADSWALVHEPMVPRDAMVAA